MLDAGCAALHEAEAVCTALLEDAAGCTALLEVEGRCTEAPTPESFVTTIAYLEDVFKCSGWLDRASSDV